MFKRNIIALATMSALMSPAEAAVAAGGAAAEKKPFCSKEYDLETGLASFTFGNGTTLEQTVDELPANIQRQLMLHGFMQKVGDSYAGAKGNFAEGIDNAKGVIEALKSGEWGTGRDSDGKPRLDELAEAIARVKGIPVEDAKKAAEAADEDKRKTWRAHPKIKAAIALIRSEKAQKALEAATDAGDISL